MIKISPSMMCANFLNLEHDLSVFKEERIEYLHIDIMDGHYVPNFTLGPGFCSFLDDVSDIPLDIHLMIENADYYIPRFTGFTRCMVSIHPETVYHPIRTLQTIKERDAVPAVSVDPAIPLESVKPLLPYIEMVCIMTVNPGYSGQKLIPQTLDKIHELSILISREGYPVEIEVDGNVSWENIPVMVEAGADILVAGTSSLFERGGDLRKNIGRIREIAESAGADG
jgi:ribulose-phosphate 3-epimerase